MKKIVLIGDSIRQGYDKYVKMAFQGVADVYYPDANCRFTTHILRHLLDWKEKMGCGDDVDAVHWNACLWDNLILPDGKNHVPIEMYAENVARICNMIEILFPKAKIIYATATPCNEEFFKTYKYKRTNADTELYNRVACDIVRDRGGEIDDIYAVLKDSFLPLQSDQTHYYTKEGTRVIAGQVIRSLEESLEIKAKELDYDLLFDKKTDAEGM